MKKYLLILFAAVSLVYSCDDKPSEPDPVIEDKVTLSIVPVFGSEDLVVDQTYISDEGYQVQFTDLKLYMSDIANGSKQMVRTGLWDYRANGRKMLTQNGKYTDFTNLTAILGVPASRNHADPTQYSTSDPLNIMVAEDMHWGWNPGYIFIKVEARVDTIPDGNDLFDHYVVFHVGGDDYVRDLNFGPLTWQAAGTNTFEAKLKLDMKKFLNNGTSSIDLKTEYTSHTAPGQEAISLKVIDHFKEALGVY